MPEDLIPRSAVKEALKAVKEKGHIFCNLDNEESRFRKYVILRKALDAVDAIPAVEVKE